MRLESEALLGAKRLQMLSNAFWGKGQESHSCLQAREQCLRCIRSALRGRGSATDSDLDSRGHVTHGSDASANVVGTALFGIGERLASGAEFKSF